MAVINSNLLSLTACQHQGRANSELSSTLERLSAGLKINNAADDAAGLAIGNQMVGNLNANECITKSNNGVISEVPEEMTCLGILPNGCWSPIDFRADRNAHELSKISYQRLLTQNRVLTLGFVAIYTDENYDSYIMEVDYANEIKNNEAATQSRTSQ